MSPPDWNWADFCGRELLQVKLHHDARLPADLRKLVDDSILHAARSIQKRNVGPGYTNIAILGTYVTLVAAETYDLPDLKQYASARLRRFHVYTLQQGGFTEYNSPTYTLVSLKGLAQLRADVKDAEARKLADELYRMAWEEVATHFHPPTRQWAGPHSRAYSTFLRPSVLDLIQRATQNRVHFGIRDESIDLESYRVPLDCPRDFEPFFTKLDAPRTLVKTFVKSDPPVIGTTYLHPGFTLSSINRGDLWNQRRALVAYWGTPAAPKYLHLRFLRDGYDFAAAQFFSQQHENSVLGIIVLATDGGQTHVSLDRMKNGTFRAKDLRVRFEIGGVNRLEHISHLGSLGSMISARDMVIDINGVCSGFESLAQEESNGGLEWVFHSGAEREFHLSEMGDVAIAFRLMMGSDQQVGRPPELLYKLEKGTIGVGSISVSTKPATVAQLHKSFHTNWKWTPASR